MWGRFISIKIQLQSTNADPTGPCLYQFHVLSVLTFTLLHVPGKHFLVPVIWAILAFLYAVVAGALPFRMSIIIIRGCVTRLKASVTHVFAVKNIK